MSQDNLNYDDIGFLTSQDVSLLERITPLAQQVNCLDIEQIANICVEKIPKLIGARFASLYILDEANSILHLQKYNHPFLLNKIVSLNQQPLSLMVMAVRSKEIVVTDNIDTFKRPIIKKSQRPFSKNYQTKNCAIIPLVCQGQVVGILNLSDKRNGWQFSRDEAAVIKLLSQLIGASIGNIKLFEKMQRQAITDGLTGLANHKTFYEVLEKELWRSRRYGDQISVIMIDVDNLKHINDVYGHRAGDKAIRAISRRIKQCIRQIDTAARYGGDEFAVILPNTSLTEATIAAERMVNVVAKSPINWKDEQITISVSIGLGQYSPDCTAEDIASRSDQALYAAKQAGKNTFRVFEPIQPQKAE